MQQPSTYKRLDLSKTMIIEINDKKTISSIALGDIAITNNNDKHVASALLQIDGKTPIFMFPIQRLAFTPTGTDFSGKAKFQSFFLPLEVSDGVLKEFFAMLEAHLQRLLFAQRSKLFSEPSKFKTHRAVEVNLTYQSLMTREDGTPYLPLFQPRLVKVWRDKVPLSEFNVRCTVVDVDKHKRNVELNESNLGEYLIGGSDVALITTMRQIRVVENKVLCEMEVKQMVVVHKEPPALPKDALLTMMGLASPEEEEEAAAVAAPVAKKRKASSSSSAGAKEEEKEDEAA